MKKSMEHIKQMNDDVRVGRLQLLLPDARSCALETAENGVSHGSCIVIASALVHSNPPVR